MSEEEYSKGIAALKNGNATGIDDVLVNKCQNISSFVLQFSYLYMVGLLISYWVDFFIFQFCYNFKNCRKVFCVQFIIISSLSFNLVFP